MYAIDSLNLSLFALQHDLRVDQVAAMGGDSDSNSTIYGALYGAKYGVQGFERNWLHCVLTQDPNAYIISRALQLLKSSK